MGSGAAPLKILFFDPMLGGADLTMVLCMIFRTWFLMRWFSVHGFGRNGFRSMVLDASACINMYCNIERNIMKKIKLVVPVLGSSGKSLCMCFMCYALTFLFF